MKRLTWARSRCRATYGEGPDTGASAVEYALLAAAVAAVIAVVVFAFGTLVLDLNHDNCTTISDGVSANIGVSADCDG